MRRQDKTYICIVREQTEYRSPISEQKTRGVLHPVPFRCYPTNLGSSLKTSDVVHFEYLLCKYEDIDFLVSRTSFSRDQKGLILCLYFVSSGPKSKTVCQVSQHVYRVLFKCFKHALHNFTD